MVLIVTTATLCVMEPVPNNNREGMKIFTLDVANISADYFPPLLLWLSSWAVGGGEWLVMMEVEVEMSN